LKLNGIESSFVGGFRFTTPEIFEVVENVLANEVGPKVAQTLVHGGIKAQAISGRTLPTLIARKRSTLVDGTPTELGQVGDVVRVNTSELLQLIGQGIVPVVAPIASDENTGGLNVNADLAAAAIAGALDASSLIIMTDVAGIYRNWPDESSLIDVIQAHELSEIKSTFAQGMAPKVQAALDAIKGGAKAVRIIDGTDPHSFADALLSKGGTLVIA
jgi:acetylglutamate kinase